MREMFELIVKKYKAYAKLTHCLLSTKQFFHRQNFVQAAQESVYKIDPFARGEIVV